MFIIGLCARAALKPYHRGDVIDITHHRSVPKILTHELRHDSTCYQRIYVVNYCSYRMNRTAYQSSCYQL